MAKPTRAEIGLLVLAGIGAGTLLGAVIGLLLDRRAAGPGGAAMAGTVDELKEKAEHVLDELSENVSELVGRSRRMAAEPSPPR